MDTPALADPNIQAELLLDALRSASVGLLVWDEHRRYIAANDSACEILGTTLPELPPLPNLLPEIRPCAHRLVRRQIAVTASGAKRYAVLCELRGRHVDRT